MQQGGNAGLMLKREKWTLCPVYSNNSKNSTKWTTKGSVSLIGFFCSSNQIDGLIDEDPPLPAPWDEGSIDWPRAEEAKGELIWIQQLLSQSYGQTFSNTFPACRACGSLQRGMCFILSSSLLPLRQVLSSGFYPTVSSRQRWIDNKKTHSFLSALVSATSCPSVFLLPSCPTAALLSSSHLPFLFLHRFLFSFHLLISFSFCVTVFLHPDFAFKSYKYLVIGIQILETRFQRDIFQVFPLQRKMLEILTKIYLFHQLKSCGSEGCVFIS